MSVGLSLHDHCLRETLVTHTHWVRFMVRTLVIDLVAETLHGHTVLALLVWLVLALALGLHL